MSPPLTSRPMHRHLSFSLHMLQNLIESAIKVNFLGKGALPRHFEYTDARARLLEAKSETTEK